MAPDPDSNPECGVDGEPSLLPRPVSLWIGFAAVHAVVALLALFSSGFGLSDVTTHYQVWASDALAGFVPGIDSPWVYPIGALVPVVAPAIFGVGNYVLCWLILVVLLDAVAFAVLVTRSTGRRRTAAWWWLAFTVLLGPVALSRLDGLSVPIVIVGLLWLVPRPRTATILLTVATWIKVWPIAVLASLIVATRHRWRVIVTALGTSAVIAFVALASGSGSNLFSFVTAQTGRGLQVEAPVSTLWMWEASARLTRAHVVYDRPLNTFEVIGPGARAAAAVMTPLLFCALAGILLVGVYAVRRRMNLALALPSLALALVTALIVFNKVGSPQYVSWLAAPIVIGLASCGRSFRVPAILVAAIAALTQAFYPYLYDSLLQVNPILLAVLTARNTLLVVVLGWSIWSLCSSTIGDEHAEPADAASVWPFSRPRSLHS